MPKMKTGHKEPRPSALHRARSTGPLLHSSQQSLQEQFNSLIETLKRAKQEHNGRSSSSGPVNRVEHVRGVREEQDVGDRNDRTLMFDRGV